jgi:TonB family protein
MEVEAQPVKAAVGDLPLYLEWKSAEDTARSRKALAGSVLLHIAGVIALLLTPPGFFRGRDVTPPPASLNSPVALVAPPAELTQPEPNRSKPSKEFDLQRLLPRPRLQLPPSFPSTTRPAASAPPPAIPTPALPEPPAVEPAKPDTGQLPAVARGVPPVAPPQIQPEEKPKLAFEQVGAPAGVGGQSAGVLKPPSNSVAELGRELGRNRGAGGVIVGDLGEGVGGLGEGLNQPPSPGKPASSLELLSDPAGVDFRPYLVGILSSIRRNWFAVMPQSVKLGQQGKVVIQFAISRDGSVPKLVIASPSGALALDRAAVAGVSASTPFPPLPTGFRGLNVRLQLVFTYNMH